MTICINRCVLMILRAMPGIRNGICNGCFYSTKESLGRYIRERKLLLAARDLRDTDQRVYDICLKYGFDSQQTFTRIFTRTFNQRRAHIAKRTTAAHWAPAAYQSASIGGLFCSLAA